MKRWPELLLILVAVVVLALISCEAQVKVESHPKYTNQPPAWNLDVPPSGQTTSNKPVQLESVKQDTNAPAIDPVAIYRTAFADGARLALLAAMRNPDVHNVEELTRIAWQLRSTVKMGTNQP